MADFRINVELEGLLDLSPMVRAGVFAHLSAAVKRVTKIGAERWQAAVLEAPLWQGEQKAYADSITWQMTGEFSGEIVSTYRYAEDIESGRPPYDMKKMLDTSMKVRVSKKGRRYLIIPFRHNTPGNEAHAKPMPDHVYDEAQDLSPSKIVGHGRRASGTGAYDVNTKQPFLVRSRAFQWGGRLPEGLTPKLKPEHKTDIHAGMVRFDARTPGGQRYSKYFTFRVMAEGSSGWIKPAKPGLFIVQNLVRDLQPLAEKVFQRAISIDTAA